MRTEVHPLFKKVVFTEKKKEETSTGGIFLAGTSDETSSGIVTAVGPDVDLVKVGDEVFVNWLKATKMKIDGEILFIVDQEEIAMSVKRKK